MSKKESLSWNGEELEQNKRRADMKQSTGMEGGW